MIHNPRTVTKRIFPRNSSNSFLTLEIRIRKNSKINLLKLILIERKSEANEARATLTHQWSRERVKKADEHVRSEQDRADN